QSGSFQTEFLTENLPRGPVFVFFFFLVFLAYDMKSVWLVVVRCGTRDFCGEGGGDDGITIYKLWELRLMKKRMGKRYVKRAVPIQTESVSCSADSRASSLSHLR
ncbi:unnamed protein product, partial [Brassica oleracea]